MDVNGENVEFKLDTGAQVNVLPTSIYKVMNPRPKLKPSCLTAYNNTEIPVHGKCIGNVTTPQGKRFNVLFVVVSTDSPAILGLKTCERMNLIQRLFPITSANDFFEEFKYCFGEIGCLKRTYHIELKPHSKPIQSPFRKIPIAKVSSRN